MHERCPLYRDSTVLQSTSIHPTREDGTEEKGVGYADCRLERSRYIRHELSVDPDSTYPR